MTSPAKQQGFHVPSPPKKNLTSGGSALDQIQIQRELQHHAPDHRPSTSTHITAASARAMIEAVDQALGFRLTQRQMEQQLADRAYQRSRVGPGPGAGGGQSPLPAFSSPASLLSSASPPGKKSANPPPPQVNHQRNVVFGNNPLADATHYALNPIPMRNGNPDLFKWFDELDYDPRSAKEREEAKKREQAEELQRKKLASLGSLQRKLMSLSSSMRSEMSIFVDYLLDYGVRHHQIGTNVSKQLYQIQQKHHQQQPLPRQQQMTPKGKKGSAGGAHADNLGATGRGDDQQGQNNEEAEEPEDLEGGESSPNNNNNNERRRRSNADPLTSFASALPRHPEMSIKAGIEAGLLPNRLMYMQLRDCFEILDFDESGTISVEELRKASHILERNDVEEDKAFRTLDVNRSGSLDFLEVLKVFFPKGNERQLMKVHALFGKPYEKNGGKIPVRDRLSKEDLAEIDARYDSYCSRWDPLTRMFVADPRNCTLETLRKMLFPEVVETGLVSGATSMNLSGGSNPGTAFPPSVTPPQASTSDQPKPPSAALLEDSFHRHDIGGKGYLTRDEFTEMFKYSYSPFSGPKPGDHEKESLAWLTKRRERDPKSLRLPNLTSYVPKVPSYISLTAPANERTPLELTDSGVLDATKRQHHSTTASPSSGRRVVPLVVTSPAKILEGILRKRDQEKTEGALHERVFDSHRSRTLQYSQASARDGSGSPSVASMGLGTTTRTGNLNGKSGSLVGTLRESDTLALSMTPRGTK